MGGLANRTNPSANAKEAGVVGEADTVGAYIESKITPSSALCDPNSTRPIALTTGSQGMQKGNRLSNLFPESTIRQ